MKRGEGLDFGETNFQILEFGKEKRGKGLRVVTCRNWEELLQHGACESATRTPSPNSKRQARIAFPCFSIHFQCFNFVSLFLYSS